MSDRYTYRITWSAEDGENVGLCAEFPSLSWLASSPEESAFGHKAAGARCGIGHAGSRRDAARTSGGQGL